MAGWAAGLWALYGLVAFVARLLLQRLLTGSWGFSGIQGGPVAWVGGLAFVGALAAATAAPILQLNDAVEPFDAIDTPPLHALGFVLFAIGLLGTVSAQLAMGGSWRIGVGEGEQTEMITAGPFETVRNPIYLAMFVVLVGSFLLAPNIVSLTAFFGLVLALEIQVRLVEEPHLRRIHGDAYAEYASQVGRFVPGVGRVTAPHG
jgi:protein-S-isoprenylcysteine O-methyltransferase Ste14